MNNQFVYAFQEIVNTYGIPKYQEINPGLYAIVSFPFLFGVMFGDIGHGMLLANFGLYLIYKTNKNNEREMLYRCRYLVTLMGFFAIFCGFIYNDFMSLPLNLLGSCYQNEETNQREDENCIYKFGLDPVWLVSQNNLQFYNSFKMKLSIVLGVSQMILGIFLKGINNCLSFNLIDFFFEFLPQLFFMLSTFGYMVLLIILKWTTNFKEQNPPSLLNMMLNLGLKGGKISENENLLIHFGINKEGQEYFQGFLVSMAFLCVPLMLLPKPFFVYLKNKKSEHENHEYQPLKQNDEENLISDVQEELKKKETNNQEIHNSNHDDDFQEILVHQVIESIEFVLGSISHTASYLRLWALSLAHSQLAHVFFQKTLEGAIQNANAAGIVVGFLVFSGVTFGVLMCMDVMECFLHTLRLHWVEFQSKFYKADGILFKPFSFLFELEQIQGVQYGE
ncbi:v-type ATPase 116kda subunit family protein, putative [Ichthyophthirius multifiliis]|uniref:V-type proton ATPase subunit a n=1 Tax=Ichthyophthirius multifiliis TaxID=5932 RepID=G0QP00_ICHMU|nr:v-type ATPase 116kda subunit family protein, putative [Ichthyophthirius multifiliis]EGR33058.1 v-type ATPase 116kda subunit family protein, putative [Ichthyophthirius multifiliis]|eukprot:XP_004037044.1 v-type ATPase 116kda subunit family protein, putative [Ichthyophthirius multifiliis]